METKLFYSRHNIVKFSILNSQFSIIMLISGLITGLLFGFFLQRGKVLRYDKQIGALRLMDMTILKFMLSAIVVGLVSLYLLSDLGFITFQIKKTILGPLIVGGSLFGIGWAMLGYCPGTCAGAIGEGRLDAIWGFLGGLVGAGIYALVYPINSLNFGDFGAITLPEILNINHWIVIVFFVGGVFALFRWFEKLKI